MKRILITGGFGFVGGRIAKKLSGAFEVLVSSRKKPGVEMLSLHNNPGYVQHSSLLDTKKFPPVIDTVIHLAALNEWDCVASPSEAIEVNINQSRIILENAIANGTSRFIYFSTAHIYGSPLQGNIDESTLPQPQHPYAITHRAAEDYILAAIRQRKISGTVLRLSNSFGAPVSAFVNRWTLLANDLAKQAIEKQQLTLLSNGCQFRDFITLEDVENIVFDMISDDTGKHAETIYNLGSGAAMRVIDMAERIVANYKEIYGKEIEIKFPENIKPTNEPSLFLSNEKLIKTGIKPVNDIDKELKRLLQFCSENFKQLQA